MNLTFDCEKTEIFSAGNKHVRVELNGVDTYDIDNQSTDILKHIDIGDVIEHYGYSDLLDVIGKDKAIEWFEIEGQ